MYVVFGCSCECTCFCMHMRGGQRSSLSIFPQAPFIFFFFETVSYWPGPWHLDDQSELVCHGWIGIHPSQLPSPHSGLLYMSSAVRTQVPMLIFQALYLLRHLPSSQWCSLDEDCPTSQEMLESVLTCSSTPSFYRPLPSSAHGIQTRLCTWGKCFTNKLSTLPVSLGCLNFAPLHSLGCQQCPLLNPSYP